MKDRQIDEQGRFIPEDGDSYWNSETETIHIFIKGEWVDTGRKL